MGAEGGSRIDINLFMAVYRKPFSTCNALGNSVREFYILRNCIAV